MKDEIERATVKAERKAKRKAEKRQHKAEAEAKRDEQEAERRGKAFKEAYGWKSGTVIPLHKRNGHILKIIIP